MCDRNRVSVVQPTLGEDLAAGLKAQADFLQGTGSFAETGSLKQLLPLEQEVRGLTADMETDLLGRTLLGNQTITPSPATAVTQADVDAGLATEDQIGQFAVREQIPVEVEGSSPTLEALNAARSNLTGEEQINEIVSIVNNSNVFTEAEKSQITLDMLLNGTSPTLDSINPIRFNEFPDEQRFETVLDFTNDQGEPYQRGEVKRTGGLIDLLGDKRGLIGRRLDFEQYVLDNEDIRQNFLQDKFDGVIDDNETMAEYGRRHYETHEVGKAEVKQGRIPPRETIGVTNRIAGFAEDGDFLGLSAFGQDLETSALSRRREADLMDVNRLSDLYQETADKFRDPLSPRRIGEVGGEKDTTALFEDQERRRRLGIAEAEQPQRTGLGLREQLILDAQDALGKGLTDREINAIEQASRARQTAMGNIFNPSSTIDEAKSVIEEDRNRLMQNRGFAQSVLGQEAGLRQGDIQLERSDRLDPFAAILGRTGTNALAQGQGLIGTANYGPSSQPMYLRPESTLGYSSNRNANILNLLGAQQAANASRTSGIFQGLGSVLGGALTRVCWVAREVYGTTNPKWLLFREWLFSESPRWFFRLYLRYGEKFAIYLRNKPRLKSLIRRFMDSKIGT